MKIFEKNGIKAAGNVLPYSDFRLFRDIDTPTFNTRKLNAVVKEAEGFLEQPVPMLPASLYREFFVNGNRANYEGLYFRRRRMAIILALAEKFEGKGRFTDKLIDTVWAIMEESTWIIPAHLYVSPFKGNATLGPLYKNENLHGIDLFAAATGSALALVYHCAKDAIDSIEPIVCEKMKYILHERIALPYLQCVFWWGGERGNRINNWCPWIVSNVLFTVAVTEEDQYIREKTVEKALAHTDNFLNMYAPDGGCDEGPSYWNAAGAAMFDCLELLEDMSGGKINIYGEPLVKNIGEYICKMNVNANNFINFADCNPRLIFDCAMLVRYGRKLGSENLESFGRMMAGLRDCFADANLAYRSLKCMVTPDITPERCVAATDVWFPDLKVMVVRESSDSTEGILLGAKGGNNDEMHNHNDVGNFVVYKNGRPVIIDTGVGVYTKQTFSSRRYELWFMQSGYHNLPSFGGVDQKNGAAFRSNNERYTEGEKRLSLELSGAYPQQAGLIGYERTLSLSGGKVTVNDTFSLDKGKQVDFHFMTASEPTVSGRGRIALAEGMTLSYDSALECEIEAFDPVGMNTKASWDTETLYRIHLKVNAECGSYTFTFE